MSKSILQVVSADRNPKAVYDLLVPDDASLESYLYCEETMEILVMMKGSWYQLYGMSLNELLRRYPHLKTANT